MNTILGVRGVNLSIIPTVTRQLEPPEPLKSQCMEGSQPLYLTTPPLASEGYILGRKDYETWIRSIPDDTLRSMRTDEGTIRVGVARRDGPAIFEIATPLPPMKHDG